MSRNRLWMLVLAAFCIIVLVLGWFAAVKPQLDLAASDDASAASVQAQNQAQQAALVALKKQYDNLPTLTAKLAGLRAAVPSSIDAASLVQTINATANLVGLKVTTITVGDPAVFIAASAAASPSTAPATQGTTSQTATPTPTPSASTPATTPTTPAGGVVAIAPADSALVSTGDFITVPVSISVQADYSAALTFITSLQSATRLFLMTGCTLTGGTTGAAPTGTITGLVYVLVDKSAAKAAATPTPTSSPTPTPTPTVTPTLTPTPTATTKP